MHDLGTSRAVRKAAGLMCVMFLVGILVGTVGGRVWERQKEAAAPHARVSDFMRELALTPDQEGKVQAILDDTARRLRALYAPLDSQREQILRQSENQIRAILMPEQLPKFEEFERRVHAHHKAHR